LAIIPKLQRRKITVSLGHSQTDVTLAETAIRAGARCLTHLFNAMPPFHHRDPGLVGVLGSTTLPSPLPYYGIICDGVHVHPNSLRMAYRSHPAGVILVTDAVSAAGLPPGEYTVGGERVTKTKDRVYVYGTKTLAGSCVTMPECLRNFHKFTRCGTLAAIHAATLAPAKLLELEGKKGSLVAGADADFVLLDEEFTVRRVFIAGEEVDLLAS